MSHLGKNPVRGGSPLSDNKESRESAVNVGVFDQEVDNSYMFLVFKEMKVRNSVDVIKI